MNEKQFNVAANASDLTAEEIEIAQWRVDITNTGTWKIDEIYGETWSGQDKKQDFGKKFKAAVEGGRLSRISVLKHDNGLDMLSSDRQQLYATVKKPG